MYESSVAAFWVLLLCVFIALTGLGVVSPIIPNYAVEDEAHQDEDSWNT